MLTINLTHQYGRFTSFNQISNDKVDDNKLQLLVNGDDSCIPEILELEKPFSSISGMSMSGFDILTKYRAVLIQVDSSIDDSLFSSEFIKTIKKNQFIYNKTDKYQKELTLLAESEDGSDFLLRDNNLGFYLYFSNGAPEFQRMGILQALEWCEVNAPNKAIEIFGEKHYVDERLAA